VGLAVINGVVAKNNDVYGNYDGIYTQDMTSLIAGNRIFSNADDGILVTAYGALITGNRIYSNKNGIAGTLYTNGRYDIENNLIYANTAAGIDIGGGGNQLPNNKIIGNTIYQSVGTGVKLSASSVNTTLGGFADRLQRRLQPVLSRHQRGRQPGFVRRIDLRQSGGMAGGGRDAERRKPGRRSEIHRHQRRR